MFFFFTTACLRRRRTSRVQLGMTKKRQISWQNLFSHTCSNAVVTMCIDLSASASLHCCSFKYTFTFSELLRLLKDSPTGCFLGCHCRKWGADLHSHSVSWHDRFHSECCEWPPSNPEDGTWDRQTERLLVQAVRVVAEGGITWAIKHGIVENYRSEWSTVFRRRKTNSNHIQLCFCVTVINLQHVNMRHLDKVLVISPINHFCHWLMKSKNNNNKTK